MTGPGDGCAYGRLVGLTGDRDELGLEVDADGSDVRDIAQGSADALTLLGALWVVLASVTLVGRGPMSESVMKMLLWCLTAVLVLNTLGNARGRHPVERWGAGSVTALLAVLCAVMAVN
jgi:hypothetical protein